MLLMSFFPFVVFMREPRGLLSQNHLQVGGLETHPSLSLHRVALVLSSRFTSSFGEDAGTSPEEFEAYRTGPKLAVTRCLCLRRLGFPRSAVLARILPVVRASARSCACDVLPGNCCEVQDLAEVL